MGIDRTAGKVGADQFAPWTRRVYEPGLHFPTRKTGQRIRKSVICMTMHLPPVIEAASWRIAAEICRAAPSLLIRQTHPGGGQYDCLSLRDEAGRHFADLNRKGALHVFACFDGREPEKESWDAWSELPHLDAAALVTETRRRLGQAVPARLPASTARMLLYRFVAACLGMHTFARSRWSCVSVAHDSSGFEGYYVRPEARKFAGLSA